MYPCPSVQGVPFFLLPSLCLFFATEPNEIWLNSSLSLERRLVGVTRQLDLGWVDLKHFLYQRLVVHPRFLWRLSRSSYGDQLWRARARGGGGGNSNSLEEASHCSTWRNWRRSCRGCWVPILGNRLGKTSVWMKQWGCWRYSNST